MILWDIRQYSFKKMESAEGGQLKMSPALVSSVYNQDQQFIVDDWSGLP